MSDRTRTLVLVIALIVMAAGVVLTAGSAGGRKTPDADQRPGLVETAQMFEETSTFYPSGAEYAQAVYASQDIVISTDIEADSYSVDSVSPGDVVIGAGYVGILVDDTTAMGVLHEGGPVQVFRVTNEDVRRVDW